MPLKERTETTPVFRPPARALIALGLAAGALLVVLPGSSSPASDSSPIAVELDRLLAGKALASSRTSVYVLDAETGESLYARNPDLPLKPASNMKLVTAAAGIALLKPEYQFRTVFHAARQPDAAGVIRGDFYIKGGGSPGLVGEHWWMIARRIRALGVKRIEGDLVGDDTFFDDLHRGPRWPSPAVDNPYNAPVGALSCFYNAVSVTVRPTAAGEPPAVFLEPFESFFKVVNRAVTAGSGVHLSVDRRWDGKRNEILVGGRIGTYSEPYTAYRSVEEPTLYTLAAFREAAAKEGIEITGSDRRGTVPPGTPVLYTHMSQSLAELVHDMNKNSNNFMAESILKTIGAEMSEPPGTSAKGSAAVMSYLQRIGVDTKGIVIADGSGLSADNRLTARALARLLLATHQDFHAAPEFLASLPVGGIDGTLDRRMHQSPATRNIRAKTGRINGVTTLSGYAWNKDGRLVVFSILVNDVGSQEWAATHLIDELCTAMVEADLPPEPTTQKGPTRQGG